MALFSHGLLPASFRGVPFAVTNTDEQFGRRVALHVYPGRDEPWAEDMGRSPRQFTLRGFLVTDDQVYLGGPIQIQRLLLTAAAEKSGSGTLTHPTLGVLNVACLRFTCSEANDAARYSEVLFELVESGKRSFPSLLSSSSGLLSAANLCKVALALDLVRGVALAIGAGGRHDDALAAAARLSAPITDAATDATSLTRLTALLPGNFGRYAQGANVGYVGSNASSYSADTSIADIAAAASLQRQAVYAAAAAVQVTIGDVGVSTTDQDVGNSIATLADSLLAACADPSDAIRLFSGILSGSAVGQGGVDGAVTIGFRRAIVTALAKAVSLYQPESYDDAFATMASVAALIDTEATAAADNGDDRSYKALRGLRAQVVTDLRDRGAVLARVRTFVMPQPTPALVLAQRYYRAPDRAAQLLVQAKARSPLFMPTSFQALAA